MFRPHHVILLLLSITWPMLLLAQPCGVAQTLTPLQESEIGTLVNLLDTALKYEDLHDIDSLNEELKASFGTEAGIPEAIENYDTLITNTTWLSTANAITLSRLLLKKDSMVYVDLWKMSKGMKPPVYQPHSIFLRASAEIASGLLKIADKETDATRKALYQFWATRALDSLATMQLPSGAFPFPDLRTYGDATFGPILQKFLLSLGDDSVNVMQNGWLIDDKGTGEFKFDAGVIANAYYEAYQLTGKSEYRDIVISIGNYSKNLIYNSNFNYNTFSSLALTRAYQLTTDDTYLDRAVNTLRYSVYPGQIPNGRWVDGHNANSRYHSIIIQNIASTISLIPSISSYKTALENMNLQAIKNLALYTNTCKSATGFRWLLKAYQYHSENVSLGLKDSLSDLIGRYIVQSTFKGENLDIPTMGEYFELLGIVAPVIDHAVDLSSVTLFPNPTEHSIMMHISEKLVDGMQYQLINAHGRIVFPYASVRDAVALIDLSGLSSGIYFLQLRTFNNQAGTFKLVKE